MQKPPAKVHTNRLSDKNRIAETPHPQIDRKTLEALRTLGNQMPPSPPPGMPSMPEPAVAPQPASSASSQSPVNTAQPPRMQPTETPQEPPPADAFKMPGSAGDSIAQAARSTRPRFPGGGGSGGYGYGQGSSDRRERFGGMDILSDTQGVDFGPYLARIHPTIQMNWMLLEPEAARPPMMKHGKVTIRLLIMPDGKVVGANIESSSGDISLDRAAFGGITASSPLPPLPSESTAPTSNCSAVSTTTPPPAKWNGTSSPAGASHLPHSADVGLLREPRRVAHIRLLLANVGWRNRFAENGCDAPAFPH